MIITKTFRVGLVVWMVAVSFSATAEDALGNVVKMGFGDMGEIKKRAEAGDPAAQVSLGDALVSSLRKADALVWYRKAAHQRYPDGEERCGSMLLFGTAAERAEGLKWTFMAATNGDAGAMLNMSKAFEQGLGTSANLVQAYAWSALFADTGVMTGRVYMNALALKMTTPELDAAKQLAVKFKMKHWERPVIRVIPENALRLAGISSGAAGILAIVNGTTFSKGDSGKVRCGSVTIRLKCLDVTKDKVSVLVEGEEEPRILALQR